VVVGWVGIVIWLWSGRQIPSAVGAIPLGDPYSARAKSYERELWASPDFLLFSKVLLGDGLPNTCLLGLPIPLNLSFGDGRQEGIYERWIRTKPLAQLMNCCTF